MPRPDFPKTLAEFQVRFATVPQGVALAGQVSVASVSPCGAYPLSCGAPRWKFVAAARGESGSALCLTCRARPWSLTAQHCAPTYRGLYGAESTG